ncbi:MAG: hypothetical protein ACRCSY_09030 [Cetobacterium sp.]
MSKKFGVIDMETGELLRETPKKEVAFNEANTSITKDMLKEPSFELVKYLYSTMKKDGTIDRFGMIRVDGLYVSEEFFKIGGKAGVLAPNLFNMKSVLSFRGFIKKNETCDCETWTEVMEALGVETSNKRKTMAMKKLLLDNDIIRETRKPYGKKVYVVNPNILRHGSHTSDFCISTFKDLVLLKIDKFNKYLMYLNGLLEADDID